MVISECEQLHTLLRPPDPARDLVNEMEVEEEVSEELCGVNEEEVAGQPPFKHGDPDKQPLASPNPSHQPPVVAARCAGPGL